MKKAREFFKKNCKLLSLGCAAVFLSLTAAVSSAFLIPNENTTDDIQTVQAESVSTNGNWIDSSKEFATKDSNGNALGLVESKPILINSAEEFAYLVDYIKNLNATEFKYYKLTSPIDLSAHYWYPIGESSVFNGQLDCDFNPITGLNLDTDQTTIVDTYGLFGASDELVIKNAIISGAKITVREKIGAAGIILGTLNHSSGKIEVTNSSISGTITHMGSSPSKRDGVGALVGSIVDSGSSNKLENVSVNVSIEATNRISKHGIGTIVGCSTKSVSVFNSYFNVPVKILGDTTATSNKYYVGNFGGDTTSNWFYIDSMNGGLPVLSSHYWIGNHITCTGTQVTNKLKANGYTETTAASLVQDVKAYNIASSYVVSNNTTRTGFSISTATRTGLNQAIEGEIVKLSTTNPTGYSFIDYTLNGSSTTEESFEMPAKDTTVIANFEPNRYTLTLNVNGGTISSSTAIVEYDASLTLPKATKSGYTLTGWWTDLTGGTKVFDGEGTLIASVDGFSDGSGKWTRLSGATLYAHWMENKAFLLSTWSDSLATQMGVSNFNALVKTIKFISTKPTSGAVYSAGATTAGTSTAGSQTAHGGTSEICFDVTAYVTGDSTAGYDVVLYSPYIIYAPVNSSYLFSNSAAFSSTSKRFSKLTSIDFANLSTINTTNMDSIFYFCTALTSLNLSGFNTKNVINMDTMFYYCRELILLDLSSFNTSNVKSMYRMFGYCSKLTTLDLSSFDTSNVTSMRQMFYYSKALTSLNLSSLNTSNVIDMYSMFEYCSKIKSLDLSSFNTSNVTDMRRMFYSCSALTSLNLSSFDTSKVVNMNYMFSYCSALTSINLSSFNTSNAIDMSCMFEGCSKLSSLYLSNFDTSKVTSMTSMFSNCSALTSLDVSSFDTSCVTDMSDMFGNCKNLTTLDLSNFDTSNVEYMTVMFSDCCNLKSLNVSSFSSTNLVKVERMFYSCQSLEKINLSGFTSSKINTLESMFEKCFALKEVNISNLRISEVQTTRYMFAYCNNLESVDLRNLNFSSVNEMEYMFAECSSLTSVAFYKFDAASLQSTSYMFTYCESLKSIDLSAFTNTINLYNTSYMFGHCEALESVDMRNFTLTAVRNVDNMFAGPPLKIFITPSICYTELPFEVTLYDKKLNAYNCVPGGSESLDLRAVVNVSFKIEYQGQYTNEDPIQVRYGASYGEIKALPEPTLHDYIFLGWSYNGKKITNSSVVEIAEDHELVSVWQMSEYAAFLHSNWQTMLSSRGITFEKIRTLKFTYTEPAKEKLADMINIGAVDQGTENGSASESDRVQAYVYENQDSDGNTVYDVIVYSPYTIYAPVLSKSLFDTYQGTTIDLENFNTSFVEVADCMFRNCPNLTSLDLSGFNTSKFKRMYAMFAEDSSLEVLDLSSFDTLGCVDPDSISDMFYNCTSLRELDLSSFDLSNYAGTSDDTGISMLPNLYLLKSPKNLSFEISFDDTYIYRDQDNVRVKAIPAGTSKSLDVRRTMRLVLNYTSGEQSGQTYSRWVRYKETVGFRGALSTATYGGSEIFIGWYTIEMGYEGSTEQIRITEETIYDLSIEKYLTDGIVLNLYDWYTHSGIEFKLTFDDQMGNVEVREVISGQPYGTLPVPQHTSHEFLGWFDKYSNIRVTENDIITTKIDTLIAHWSGNHRRSTVTMYLNNGTISDLNGLTIKGSYAYVSGYAGNDFTFPKPDREGYMFEGWYTDLAYTNMYDTAAYPYYPKKDLTLYAKWADAVMVEFDAQDGISAIKYKEFVIGDEFNITGEFPNAYKRGGYAFSHWNTKPDGTGDAIASNTVVKGDVTKLYAIYKPYTEEWTSQFLKGSVVIRLFNTIEGGIDEPIKVDNPYMNFTFRFGDYETDVELELTDGDRSAYEMVGNVLKPGEEFYGAIHLDELVAVAKGSLFEVLYEGKFVGYGRLYDPISIDDVEEVKYNQAQLSILDFYESTDEKYEGYIAIRGYIFTNPDFGAAIRCENPYKIRGGFNWETYQENKLYCEKLIVKKISVIKTDENGKEYLSSVDSTTSGEYVEIILDTAASGGKFKDFKDLFRVGQILMEVS